MSLRAPALGLAAALLFAASSIAPARAGETEIEVPRITIKLPGGTVSSLTVAVTVYVGEVDAELMKASQGAVREEVFTSAFESFVNRREGGFAGVDAALLRERIDMGLAARLKPAGRLRVLFRELSAL